MDLTSPFRGPYPELKDSRWFERDRRTGTVCTKCDRPYETSKEKRTRKKPQRRTDGEEGPSEGTRKREPSRFTGTHYIRPSRLVLRHPDRPTYLVFRKYLLLPNLTQNSLPILKLSFLVLLPKSSPSLSFVSLCRTSDLFLSLRMTRGRSSISGYSLEGVE